MNRFDVLASFIRIILYAVCFHFGDKYFIGSVNAPSFYIMIGMIAFAIIHHIGIFIENINDAVDGEIY